MPDTYLESYRKVQMMKIWVLSNLLAELKDKSRITISTEKLVELTKLTNHQACRCMGDLMKTLPGAMQLDPENFTPQWVVLTPNLSQITATLLCVVHNPYSCWNPDPDNTPETLSPEIAT